MSGIDTRVMFHRLANNPSVRLVSQRKRKVNKEKIFAIDEEVNKLASNNFIIEIKYLT